MLCLSLPFILSFFSLSRCPSGDYSWLRQQLVRGSNQRAAHLPGQGKPQPHHRRMEDVSSGQEIRPLVFSFDLSNLHVFPAPPPRPPGLLPVISSPPPHPSAPGPSAPQSALFLSVSAAPRSDYRDSHIAFFAPVMDSATRGLTVEK